MTHSSLVLIYGIVGWGHVITSPDYWRGTNGTKLTTWSWHAVFADQGLLYYWVKYVKKDVSIIIGPDLEHWSNKSSADGNVTLERVETNILTDLSCVPYAKGASPYRDFIHFTGTTKPWLGGKLNQPHVSDGRPYSEKVTIWRDTLDKILARAHATLKNPPAINEPPVGRYSTYNQMLQHIKMKKKFAWNQYQLQEENDEDIW